MIISHSDQDGIDVYQKANLVLGSPDHALIDQLVAALIIMPIMSQGHSRSFGINSNSTAPLTIGVNNGWLQFKAGQSRALLETNISLPCRFLPSFP